MIGMRLSDAFLGVTLALCMACACGAVDGQQTEQTPPAATTPPAPRILLRVNRLTEIAGHLESEDAETITVRNLKGEVETLSKSRILQIVRLVDPKPGQTGMVVMNDGQIREGVILEDAFEYVLVEIHGIRANLKRSAVSHVVLQPTFDQRYAEYKAAVKPGMYDAHLVMCRWLVDQNRYDLAHQELDVLLQQVEMHEARKLLNIVNAQLELQKQARPPRDENKENETGSAPSDTSPDDGSEPIEAESLPLLTNADVNLIRVYEIDFDHPPKITISPDTVRALIEKYGTDRQVPASQTGRNAMFRAAAEQPMEILRLMFELRARDLYPQIQVNSEPHALNLFRQRVHDTWLMNNCATSRCHGGPDAGAFVLHRKNYKNERVRYTNFLILERFKSDPQWPLINYERPEDSLVIQYGLSREDATVRKPHPRVPGWKPAFSPINPRMKQDAIEWIRSMMQPRPDYPIEFDPNRPEAQAENPRPER